MTVDGLDVSALNMRNITPKGKSTETKGFPESIAFFDVAGNPVPPSVIKIDQFMALNLALGVDQSKYDISVNVLRNGEYDRDSSTQAITKLDGQTDKINIRVNDCNDHVRIVLALVDKKTGEKFLHAINTSETENVFGRNVSPISLQNQSVNIDDKGNVALSIGAGIPMFEVVNVFRNGEFICSKEINDGKFSINVSEEKDPMLFLAGNWSVKAKYFGKVNKVLIGGFVGGESKAENVLKYLLEKGLLTEVKGEYFVSDNYYQTATRKELVKFLKGRTIDIADADIGKLLNFLHHAKDYSGNYSFNFYPQASVLKLGKENNTIKLLDNTGSLNFLVTEPGTFEVSVAGKVVTSLSVATACANVELPFTLSSEQIGTGHVDVAFKSEKGVVNKIRIQIVDSEKYSPPAGSVDVSEFVSFYEAKDNEVVKGFHQFRLDNQNLNRNEQVSAYIKDNEKIFEDIRVAVASGVKLNSEQNIYLIDLLTESGVHLPSNFDVSSLDLNQDNFIFSGILNHQAIFEYLAGDIDLFRLETELKKVSIDESKVKKSIVENKDYYKKLFSPANINAFRMVVAKPVTDSNFAFKNLSEVMMFAQQFHNNFNNLHEDITIDNLVQFVSFSDYIKKNNLELNSAEQLLVLSNKYLNDNKDKLLKNPCYLLSVLSTNYAFAKLRLITLLAQNNEQNLPEITKLKKIIEGASQELTNVLARVTPVLEKLSELINENNSFLVDTIDRNAIEKVLEYLVSDNSVFLQDYQKAVQNKRFAAINNLKDLLTLIKSDNTVLKDPAFIYILLEKITFPEKFVVGADGSYDFSQFVFKDSVDMAEYPPAGDGTFRNKYFDCWMYEDTNNVALGKGANKYQVIAFSEESKDQNAEFIKKMKTVARVLGYQGTVDVNLDETLLKMLGIPKMEYSLGAVNRRLAVANISENEKKVLLKLKSYMLENSIDKVYRPGATLDNIYKGFMSTFKNEASKFGTWESMLVNTNINQIYSKKAASAGLSLNDYYNFYFKKQGFSSLQEFSEKITFDKFFSIISELESGNFNIDDATLSTYKLEIGKKSFEDITLNTQSLYKNPVALLNYYKMTNEKHSASEVYIPSQVTSETLIEFIEKKILGDKSMWPNNVKDAALSALKDLKSMKAGTIITEKTISGDISKFYSKVTDRLKKINFLESSLLVKQDGWLDKKFNYMAQSILGSTVGSKQRIDAELQDMSSLIPLKLMYLIDSGAKDEAGQPLALKFSQMMKNYTAGDKEAGSWVADFIEKIPVDETSMEFTTWFYNKFCGERLSMTEAVSKELLVSLLLNKTKKFKIGNKEYQIAELDGIIKDSLSSLKTGKELSVEQAKVLQGAMVIFMINLDMEEVSKNILSGKDDNLESSFTPFLNGFKVKLNDLVSLVPGRAVTAPIDSLAKGVEAVCEKLGFSKAGSYFTGTFDNNPPSITNGFKQMITSSVKELDSDKYIYTLRNSIELKKDQINVEMVDMSVLFIRERLANLPDNKLGVINKKDVLKYLTHWEDVKKVLGDKPFDLTSESLVNNFSHAYVLKLMQIMSLIKYQNPQTERVIVYEGTVPSDVVVGNINKVAGVGNKAWDVAKNWWVPEPLRKNLTKMGQEIKNLEFSPDTLEKSTLGTGMNVADNLLTATVGVDVNFMFMNWYFALAYPLQTFSKLVYEDPMIQDKFDKQLTAFNDYLENKNFSIETLNKILLVDIDQAKDQSKVKDIKIKAEKVYLALVSANILDSGGFVQNSGEKYIRQVLLNQGLVEKEIVTIINELNKAKQIKLQLNPSSSLEKLGQVGDALVDIHVGFYVFRNNAWLLLGTMGFFDDLEDGGVEGYLSAWAKFAIANYYSMPKGNKSFWDSRWGRTAEAPLRDFVYSPLHFAAKKMSNNQTLIDFTRELKTKGLIGWSWDTFAQKHIDDLSTKITKLEEELKNEKNPAKIKILTGKLIKLSKGLNLLVNPRAFLEKALSDKVLNEIMQKEDSSLTKSDKALKALYQAQKMKDDFMAMLNRGPSVIKSKSAQLALASLRRSVNLLEAMKATGIEFSELKNNFNDLEVAHSASRANAKREDIATQLITRGQMVMEQAKDGSFSFVQLAEGFEKGRSQQIAKLKNISSAVASQFKETGAFIKDKHGQLWIEVNAVDGLGIVKKERVLVDRIIFDTNKSGLTSDYQNGVKLALSRDHNNQAFYKVDIYLDPKLLQGTTPEQVNGFLKVGFTGQAKILAASTVVLDERDASAQFKVPEGVAAASHFQKVAGDFDALANKAHAVSTDVAIVNYSMKDVIGKITDQEVLTLLNGGMTKKQFQSFMYYCRTNNVQNITKDVVSSFIAQERFRGIPVVDYRQAFDFIHTRSSQLLGNKFAGLVIVPEGTKYQTAKTQYENRTLTTDSSIRDALLIADDRTTLLADINENFTGDQAKVTETITSTSMPLYLEAKVEAYKAFYDLYIELGGDKAKIDKLIADGNIKGVEGALFDQLKGLDAEGKQRAVALRKEYNTLIGKKDTSKGEDNLIGKIRTELGAEDGKPIDLDKLKGSKYFTDYKRMALRSWILGWAEASDFTQKPFYNQAMFAFLSLADKNVALNMGAGGGKTETLTGVAFCRASLGYDIALVVSNTKDATSGYFKTVDLLCKQLGLRSSLFNKNAGDTTKKNQYDGSKTDVLYIDISSIKSEDLEGLLKLINSNFPSDKGERLTLVIDEFDKNYLIDGANPTIITQSAGEKMSSTQALPYKLGIVAFEEFIKKYGNNSEYVNKAEASFTNKGILAYRELLSAVVDNASLSRLGKADIFNRAMELSGRILNVHFRVIEGTDYKFFAGEQGLIDFSMKRINWGSVNDDRPIVEAFHVFGSRGKRSQLNKLTKPSLSSIPLPMRGFVERDVSNIVGASATVANFTAELAREFIMTLAVEENAPRTLEEKPHVICRDQGTQLEKVTEIGFRGLVDGAPVLMHTPFTAENQFVDASQITLDQVKSDTEKFIDFMEYKVLYNKKTSVTPTVLTKNEEARLIELSATNIDKDQKCLDMYSKLGGDTYFTQYSKLLEYNSKLADLYIQASKLNKDKAVEIPDAINNYNRNRLFIDTIRQGETNKSEIEKINMFGSGFAMVLLSTNTNRAVDVQSKGPYLTQLLKSGVITNDAYLKLRQGYGFKDIGAIGIMTQYKEDIAFWIQEAFRLGRTAGMGREQGLVYNILSADDTAIQNDPALKHLFMHSTELFKDGTVVMKGGLIPPAAKLRVDLAEIEAFYNNDEAIKAVIAQIKTANLDLANTTRAEFDAFCKKNDIIDSSFLFNYIEAKETSILLGKPLKELLDLDGTIKLISGVNDTPTKELFAKASASIQKKYRDGLEATKQGQETSSKTGAVIETTLRLFRGYKEASAPGTVAVDGANELRPYQSMPLSEISKVKDIPTLLTMMFENTFDVLTKQFEMKEGIADLDRVLEKPTTPKNKKIIKSYVDFLNTHTGVKINEAEFIKKGISHKALIKEYLARYVYSTIASNTNSPGKIEPVLETIVKRLSVIQNLYGESDDVVKNMQGLQKIIGENHADIAAKLQSASPEFIFRALSLSMWESRSWWEKGLVTTGRGLAEFSLFFKGLGSTRETLRTKSGDDLVQKEGIERAEVAKQLLGDQAKGCEFSGNLGLNEFEIKVVILKDRLSSLSMDSSRAKNVSLMGTKNTNVEYDISTPDGLSKLNKALSSIVNSSGERLMIIAVQDHFILAQGKVEEVSAEERLIYLNKIHYSPGERVDFYGAVFDHKGSRLGDDAKFEVMLTEENIKNYFEKLLDQAEKGSASEEGKYAKYALDMLGVDPSKIRGNTIEYEKAKSLVMKCIAKLVLSHEEGHIHHLKNDAMFKDLPAVVKDMPYTKEVFEVYADFSSNGLLGQISKDLKSGGPKAKEALVLLSVLFNLNAKNTDGVNAKILSIVGNIDEYIEAQNKGDVKKINELSEKLVEVSAWIQKEIKSYVETVSSLSKTNQLDAEMLNSLTQQLKNRIGVQEVYNHMTGKNSNGTSALNAVNKLGAGSAHKVSVREDGVKVFEISTKGGSAEAARAINELKHLMGPEKFMVSIASPYVLHITVEQSDLNQIKSIRESTDAVQKQIQSLFAQSKELHGIAVGEKNKLALQVMAELADFKGRAVADIIKDYPFLSKVEVSSLNGFREAMNKQEVLYQKIYNSSVGNSGNSVPMSKFDKSLIYRKISEYFSSSENAKTGQNVFDFKIRFGQVVGTPEEAIRAMAENPYLFNGGTKREIRANVGNVNRFESRKLANSLANGELSSDQLVAVRHDTNVRTGRNQIFDGADSVGVKTTFGIFDRTGTTIESYKNFSKDKVNTVASNVISKLLHYPGEWSESLVKGIIADELKNTLGINPSNPQYKQIVEYFEKSLFNGDEYKVANDLKSIGMMNEKVLPELVNFLRANGELSKMASQYGPDDPRLIALTKKSVSEFLLNQFAGKQAGDYSKWFDSEGNLKPENYEKVGRLFVQGSFTKQAATNLGENFFQCLVVFAVVAVTRKSRGEDVLHEDTFRYMWNELVATTNLVKTTAFSFLFDYKNINSSLPLIATIAHSMIKSTVTNEETLVRSMAEYRLKQELTFQKKTIFDKHVGEIKKQRAGELIFASDGTFSMKYNDQTYEFQTINSDIVKMRTMMKTDPVRYNPVFDNIYLGKGSLEKGKLDKLIGSGYLVKVSDDQYIVSKKLIEDVASGSFPFLDLFSAQEKTTLKDSCLAYQILLTLSIDEWTNKVIPEETIVKELQGKYQVSIADVDNDKLYEFFQLNAQNLALDGIKAKADRLGLDKTIADGSVLMVLLTCDDAEFVSYVSNAKDLDKSQIELLKQLRIEYMMMFEKITILLEEYTYKKSKMYDLCQNVGMLTGLCSPVDAESYFKNRAIQHVLINKMVDIKWEAKYTPPLADSVTAYFAQQRKDSQSKGIDDKGYLLVMDNIQKQVVDYLNTGDKKDFSDYLRRNLASFEKFKIPTDIDVICRDIKKYEIAKPIKLQANAPLEVLVYFESEVNEIMEKNYDGILSNLKKTHGEDLSMGRNTLASITMMAAFMMSKKYSSMLLPGANSVNPLARGANNLTAMSIGSLVCIAANMVLEWAHKEDIPGFRSTMSNTLSPFMNEMKGIGYVLPSSLLDRFIKYKFGASYSTFIQNKLEGKTWSLWGATAGAELGTALLDVAFLKLLDVAGKKMGIIDEDVKRYGVSSQVIKPVNQYLDDVAVKQGAPIASIDDMVRQAEVKGIPVTKTAEGKISIRGQEVSQKTASRYLTMTSYTDDQIDGILRYFKGNIGDEIANVTRIPGSNKVTVSYKSGTPAKTMYIDQLDEAVKHHARTTAVSKLESLLGNNGVFKIIPELDGKITLEFKNGEKFNLSKTEFDDALKRKQGLIYDTFFNGKDKVASGKAWATLMGILTLINVAEQAATNGGEIDWAQVSTNVFKGAGTITAFAIVEKAVSNVKWVGATTALKVPFTKMALSFSKATVAAALIVDLASSLVENGADLFDGNADSFTRKRAGSEIGYDVAKGGLAAFASVLAIGAIGGAPGIVIVVVGAVVYVLVDFAIDKIRDKFFDEWIEEAHNQSMFAEKAGVEIVYHTENRPAAVIDEVKERKVENKAFRDYINRQNVFQRLQNAMVHKISLGNVYDLNPQILEQIISAVSALNLQSGANVELKFLKENKDNTSHDIIYQLVVNDELSNTTLLNKNITNIKANKINYIDSREAVLRDGLIQTSSGKLLSVGLGSPEFIEKMSNKVSYGEAPSDLAIKMMMSLYKQQKLTKEYIVSNFGEDKYKYFSENGFLYRLNKELASGNMAELTYSMSFTNGKSNSFKLRATELLSMMYDKFLKLNYVSDSIDDQLSLYVMSDLENGYSKWTKAEGKAIVDVNSLQEAYRKEYLTYIDKLIELKILKEPKDYYLSGDGFKQQIVSFRYYPYDFYKFKDGKYQHNLLLKDVLLPESNRDKMESSGVWDIQKLYNSFSPEQKIDFSKYLNSRTDVNVVFSRRGWGGTSYTSHSVGSYVVSEKNGVLETDTRQISFVYNYFKTKDNSGKWIDVNFQDVIKDYIAKAELKTNLSPKEMVYISKKSEFYRRFDESCYDKNGSLNMQVVVNSLSPVERDSYVSFLNSDIGKRLRAGEVSSRFGDGQTFNAFLSVYIGNQLESAFMMNSSFVNTYPSMKDEEKKEFLDFMNNPSNKYVKKEAGMTAQNLEKFFSVTDELSVLDIQLKSAQEKDDGIQQLLILFKMFQKGREDVFPELMKVYTKVSREYLTEITSLDQLGMDAKKYELIGDMYGTDYPQLKNLDNSGKRIVAQVIREIKAGKVVTTIHSEQLRQYCHGRFNSGVVQDSKDSASMNAMSILLYVLENSSNNISLLNTKTLKTMSYDRKEKFEDRMYVVSSMSDEEVKKYLPSEIDRLLSISERSGENYIDALYQLQNKELKDRFVMINHMLSRLIEVEPKLYEEYQSRLKRILMAVEVFADKKKDKVLSEQINQLGNDVEYKKFFVLWQMFDKLGYIQYLQSDKFREMKDMQKVLTQYFEYKKSGGVSELEFKKLFEDIGQRKYMYRVLSECKKELQKRLQIKEWTDMDIGMLQGLYSDLVMEREAYKLLSKTNNTVENYIERLAIIESLRLKGIIVDQADVDCLYKDLSKMLIITRAEALVYITDDPIILELRKNVLTEEKDILALLKSEKVGHSLLGLGQSMYERRKSMALSQYSASLLQKK